MPSRLSPRVGLIPVLILIAVAAAQLAWVRGADLSPWLGGGFGMFSSLDRGSARHLHAFALEPGFEREIFAQTKALRDAERRVLAFPSDARLRAHARELAGQDGIDRSRTRALRLQLWRTRFDPETLAPSDSILRQLEVELDGRR